MTKHETAKTKPEAKEFLVITNEHRSTVDVLAYDEFNEKVAARRCKLANKLVGELGPWSVILVREVLGRGKKWQ